MAPPLGSSDTDWLAEGRYPVKPRSHRSPSSRVGKGPSEQGPAGPTPPGRGARPRLRKSPSPEMTGAAVGLAKSPCLRKSGASNMG